MVRSPMWNKLKTWLRNNPEDAAELAAIKGNKNIMKWRQKWADLRAVECEDELEAIEDLTIDEYAEGKFYTIRRISWELGGDIEGAVNFAKSCLQLGSSEFHLDVNGLWVGSLVDCLGTTNLYFLFESK